MNIKFKIWLRAIRFKFLASSALAVTNGFAMSFWYNTLSFDWFYAILTYLGIFCLHASVDLFNDYWDFKRGIDLLTKKTRFSGGTGVLPEGLLKPKQVYTAAIIFLCLGLLIGSFFVYTKGYVIALILLFATMSIVLYTTKFVNIGIGELFVSIKGLLIVIGSFYVQNGIIISELLPLGIVVGSLSSLVLYVNSIPDIVPDKTKGRKTLAIVLQSLNKTKLFIFIVFLFTFVYCVSILFFLFSLHQPWGTLVPFLTIPLALQISRKFHAFYFDNNCIIDKNFENIMGKTVLFSRTFGLMLAISIIIITLSF